MTSKSFYVEHMINGEWVEYEYDLEVDTYEPYTPAQVSGPPENCYPAEGGYVTYDDKSIRRRLTFPDKSPWETVPFSVFMEGLVQSRDLTDDPADKRYRKTAMEKAEEIIQEELYEAAVDDERARYEDAMEARYEARKNGDWD